MIPKKWRVDVSMNKNFREIQIVLNKIIGEIKRYNKKKIGMMPL